MAQGYVTGPAHVWIGIRITLASLVTSLVAQGQTSELTISGYVQGQTITPAVPSSPGMSVTSVPTPQAVGILENNQPSPTLTISTGFLPVYLGTAKTTSVIEIRRGWFPWHDDEQGSSLPADELYEGEEAYVTADINRWNEPVYAVVANIITHLGGVARGMDTYDAVGSSVVMEGYSYPLWLQFPYGAKIGMGLAGFMPPGYRFYNAILAGPDRLEPLNYSPSERRLVWRCRRYLDVVSGTSWLYDHDMGELGIIN